MKWYAFEIDCGLVATSTTKQKLLKNYCSGSSVVKIGKGIYTINVYSEEDDSVNTTYIYNSLEKANLNGWTWAVEEFEKNKSDVIVL